MPRLAKKLEEQLLAENPKLRDLGLVPVIRWVANTETPEFHEALRRQIDAIRNSPDEDEVMDWIEKVRDWPTD